MSDPAQDVKDLAMKIHRVIYSAAKHHHNADEWGTAQGARNQIAESNDVPQTGWASVFDELDEDIQRVIEPALVAAREERDAEELHAIKAINRAEAAEASEAALRAELARHEDERSNLLDTRDRLRGERDALQAQVERLEKHLSGSHGCAPGYRHGDFWTPEPPPSQPRAEKEKA